MSNDSRTPLRPVVTSKGVRVALVALLSTVLLGACGRQAPNLSAEAIRRVRLGMTPHEVEGILGQPIRIRSGSVGDTVHDYALPGIAGQSFWISYDRDRVTLVHAKLHKLLGKDRAIYEEAPHHARFETPEFEASFRGH
ncbi:MAG: hypothetical protein M3545_15555 [Acidobacteriota bacterium]|nr:hypothetical protein [Acidobacteriota bacterium]